MRDKVKLIKVGGFMGCGVKAGEHFKEVEFEVKGHGEATQQRQLLGPGGIGAGWFRVNNLKRGES